MGNGRLQWPTCRFGDGTLGGLVKSRGGMSLQADEARAKIINCEALDDKQKAKMLLLINTEPDTTLPVFTGVPDFLLGHTLSMHLEGLKADTQSDVAWRLEVTNSLKALLNLPSKAMVPQNFSRVGSTQANRVLASLEIVECVRNVLHPIVVSESAPASRDFNFSQYANENAGTLDLLMHHQGELIKFAVKFGRDAFTMFDLHDYENPFPIVHDGQEYHGGLDGGVAPHGLSIASAANQLRVAYEHKQSSAQKQRYREHHGDMVQVLPHAYSSLHVCGTVHAVQLGITNTIALPC
ncbi:TPA: hypothetical protein ACH3X2_010968 [Trebouxia sp. C0005]